MTSTPINRIPATASATQQPHGLQQFTTKTRISQAFFQIFSDKYMTRSKPSQSHNSAAPADSGRLDAAWADRVVQRLQGTLRDTLDACPPKAHTATGLARWLDLRVPLCHRLLAGSRLRASPPEVIATLPGVEGMRIFLAALAKAGLGDKQLKKANAAVQELDDLVASAGGSQRRLIDALRASQSGAANEGELPVSQQARHTTFEQLSHTLGCSTQGLIGVRIYHPSAQPSFVGDLDVVAALGRVGFQRQSAAMPLVLSLSIEGNKSAALDAQACLIPQFCTQPLPSVTLDPRERATLAIIDAAHERTSAVDIFAGPFRATHAVERENETPHLCSNIVANSPTRWILQDIFVPRDWCSPLRCEAGAYVHGALGPLRGDLRKRWFDRLPISLTPGILGRELRNTTCERYPRQQELCEWLFAKAGLDPDEYVGYRLEVTLPIMSVQHVLHCTADD
jgi:hypothetical protein